MLDRIKENWDEILKKIREDLDLSPVSFDTWFIPLKPVSLEKGVLSVVFHGKPNCIAYIERKYRIFIEISIEEVTGIKCSLNILDAGYKKSSPNGSFMNSNLNPRYTFENFVVGPSNSFAHAAALAVAESPAELYNPLFIWGGVGLGKTHLIQSIAQFILKRNSDAKVLYVTCEQFTNNLIDAIRNKNNITTTEFRNLYRSVDVLIIDDIQFITNKESTKEEIFHTFNTLFESKKQIILASDRPPDEIHDLSDRLSSRFKSGLTASIGLPDYETRTAILRSKEEIEGYHIDNAVIQFIANNIKSNIRELEGALTNVVAASRLTNKEINLELAEFALRDKISPNTARQITPELVLQIVADHFNMSPSDICSERRNKEVVLPRHIVMYFCREMTNATSEDLAKYLNKKDHSTILNGHKKIAAEIQTDENLKYTVDIIKKKLNPA